MPSNPLQTLDGIPFDLSVLSSLYPDCAFINDKARRMEAEGKIIRLKKGLYIAKNDGTNISLELIANHLYGPSYVSMSWALSYYGLIPERVYLVQSMTTKHSRNFTNPFGNFQYKSCSKEYFPIGITQQKHGNTSFLIATPEKALCDYISHHALKLRFVKETGSWLEEDLRFEMEAIPNLDLEIIAQCAEKGKNSHSIYTLLKFLQNERHV